MNNSVWNWVLVAVVACFAGVRGLADGPAKPPSPVNVVYIMSDELAFYELSHMGNKRLHTPRIDQMAKEGMRFTNALAGSPVCAPLRCTLMTGKHSGHASVRANDGGTPLRADEKTIASYLKAAGYATGGFGKWGCGGRDSTGIPEEHGFDVFYGYYDQVHAHSFYPPYLIRNSDEILLEGNKGGRAGQTYSHYTIIDEGVKFIRDHKDEPFFCYLPITPPHGMYDIPADDPAWQQYENDDWMKDPSVSQDVKNYAAMVTMVDNNVGTILDLLKELNLDDNTIVFFTGDNGGQDRFKSKAYPRGYFGPNVNPRTGVEFRGGKGNLYEGGLKIPFVVRYPGVVPAGEISDLIFYQPDMLPTLTELCTGSVPRDTDGISIMETLSGRPQDQPQREMLYWEFGQQTAVRMNNWKAIRPEKKADWELYDLSTDISEANNIAADHADTLAKMEAFAVASHEPVSAGIYRDPARKLHEKDRQAKWGTTRPPEPRRKAIKTIKHKDLIPAANLTLQSFSSENRSNDRLASYAIDGRPNTIWHTHFSSKIEQHPHELVIDLGKPYKVSGVRYLARQDGGWNGTFGQTEIAVADSVDAFGDPLKVKFAKVRIVQSADFDSPVTGRYVRIRVLSEINGGAWASASDIGILGKAVSP